MTTLYRFYVLGAPVAKARARYTSKGGVFYTPNKTKDAELLIQVTFLEQLGSRPELDATSIFKIKCWFYTKAKNRMDTDNLLKLAVDAMTGILWKDDSQVWDMEAHRRIDKENPRTEIDISIIDIT